VGVHFALDLVKRLESGKLTFRVIVSLTNRKRIIGSLYMSLQLEYLERRLREGKKQKNTPKRNLRRKERQKAADPNYVLMER
jgi:hypothetical protein